MADMMEKKPGAFWTIREVADSLELPQHVLRFWETRFPQIRPLKSGGGRRYYRPQDIDLIRGIKILLYDEGYTIKGVLRILKEKGIVVVQELGAGGYADGRAFDAGRLSEDDDDDDLEVGAGDDDPETFSDALAVEDAIDLFVDPQSYRDKPDRRPVEVTFHPEPVSPDPERRGKSEPHARSRDDEDDLPLLRYSRERDLLSPSQITKLMSVMDDLHECRRLLKTLTSSGDVPPSDEE